MVGLPLIFLNHITYQITSDRCQGELIEVPCNVFTRF